MRINEQFAAAAKIAGHEVRSMRLPNGIDPLKRPQDTRYRVCIAPMMEWTDRDCRVFHRLLSRRARLYTEMVTAAAILHGDRQRLLDFDSREHPIAVQLGGSEPSALAEAAAIAADFGYDEINLNVGCPSERVQTGAFGACLMREPALVADCVAAMKARVKIPITVKCRIGVDEQPSEMLSVFARHVIDAGIDALIVHARKAWLKGLSPRENRTIPPLDYARVHALKREFPGTPIILNGGLTKLAEMQAALAQFDGVMIGRAAYQDPALLMDVDPVFFGDAAPSGDRHAVLEAFMPYLETRLREGKPLSAMTRHLLGLYNGLPGARAFRRHLATEATKPAAGIAILRAAMDLVPRQVLASAAE